MDRSLGLDASKGILVILMLVHHTWGGLNASLVSIDLQHILIFIMGSFVLLAGMVIGLFLAVKYYNFAINRAKRDFFRSIRLYLMYLIPNLLIYLVNYRGVSNHDTFLEWVMKVVLLKGGDIAVFEILGVIGFFLIMATFMLTIISIVIRYGGSQNTFRFIVFVLSTVFGLLILNDHWLHPLIAYGFIGLSIGILISFNEFRLQKTSWVKVYIPFIFILGCLVLLGLINMSESFMLYTLVMTLMIYSVALLSVNFGFNFLVVLGNYSLLCYIFQVVICRLINLSGVFHLTTDNFLGVFLVVLFLVGFSMLGLVYFLKSKRKKSVGLDRFYKFIFA